MNGPRETWSDLAVYGLAGLLLGALIVVIAVLTSTPPA